MGPDGKTSGFYKSISMTTLVRSGEFEHMDSVREEAMESQSAIDNCDLSGEYSTAERFNVDGICLQHIVAKNLQMGPPSSTNEFHFTCARENSTSNTTWSFTTPKIKKGIHQSIKQKWQPVTRAFSRCCPWDGCSSVESSSGWRIAPFSALKRILCCASSLSSDDGSPFVLSPSPSHDIAVSVCRNSEMLTGVLLKVHSNMLFQSEAKYWMDDIALLRRA